MPPALLTSPSSLPKCLAVSSTTRVTSAEREKSPCVTENLAALLADFGGQFFRRVAALIVMHADLAALLGIGAGKRCADAGRGAGDQHRLAGKVGDREGRSS